MARSLSTTLAVFAVAFVVTPAVAHGAPLAPVAPSSRSAQPATEDVRDIVVRRRPGLDPTEREALRRDADVRLQATTRLTDTEVVRADAGRIDEALAALERDPGVLYAEPDAVVHAAPVDPFWSQQWSLLNTGQSILGRTGTPDDDIDTTDVWAMGVSGAGQVVAVVDTGILATHPDLGSQQAASPAGKDFHAGDANPEDANGHGTHVAGTIAASQDGVGISGVAPGARIVALRALGADGSGQAVNVAQAFDYAGDMGVRIVNASLASLTDSSAQRQAIQDHPSTLYVIAAGNGGADDLGDDNEVTRTYPCVDTEPNVICVAATDNRDALASFSNYGAISVDLAAPGVNIVSDYVSPQYVYMSGTSMAAPHVAATLALMRQAAPGLSAAQLKAALLDSVDHRPSLVSKTLSEGRLNAYAAVQRALQVSGQPVPDPDSDLDGIANASDDCPSVPNPVQADGDRDGTGDACEPPAPVAAAPPAPVATTAAVAPKAPTLIRLTALRPTATLCRSARRCSAKPAIFTVRVDRSATLRVELERRTCRRGSCRYATAATLSQGASSGTNTLKIGANAATRRLASGTYRMSVVAVSGSRRSGAATSRLKVRRG